ncbi:TetR family transcriptional regulator [Deinococcus piscis]|uniref:TetR family transcriptional regulator n=1 Tax=Deinococcus piscis TaxID=394230 RepID=A0ABQ3JZF8_9DEIO|nr:TetR/AcrR family transcriptional regulator [Deinococcus piscis]GHF97239.1 TetR family transcriptional regulator [Deinococcus piscis]
MREYKGTQRAAEKQAARERIVEAAARAIRRSGYGGPSVSEIMKEAGLTHGTFYAHFPSREALLAAAADRAGTETVAWSSRVAASVPPQQAAAAMIQSYLSGEHLKDIEHGCPIAALGSEMPRQAPEVRQAATARIREMIEVVAHQMPERTQAEARQKALSTVSAMVGSLILARAVNDPALCEEIREAALEAFTPKIK